MIMMNDMMSKKPYGGSALRGLAGALSHSEHTTYLLSS